MLVTAWVKIWIWSVGGYVKKKKKKKWWFNKTYGKPLLGATIAGNLLSWILKDIWEKVFKSGPSEICGRQSLKYLKWDGLLKHMFYVPMCSHKMIKNDTCWRCVGKQNASFLIKWASKDARMPQMARITSFWNRSCDSDVFEFDFNTKVINNYTSLQISLFRYCCNVNRRPIRWILLQSCKSDPVWWKYTLKIKWRLRFFNVTMN